MSVQHLVPVDHYADVPLALIEAAQQNETSRLGRIQAFAVIERPTGRELTMQLPLVRQIRRQRQPAPPLKLLVSFEKTEASYVALLSLAAALICWRQTITIYG